MTYDQSEHDRAEVRRPRLEGRAVREVAAVDSLPLAAVIEAQIREEDNEPIDDAGDRGKVDQVAE